MSEATKAKLIKKGLEPFVALLLEGVGILYPHQIKSTSDAELKRAGLKPDEVKAVRLVFPKAD